MAGLESFSHARLEAWTLDVRSRTPALVRDLSDRQFRHVPLLRIINPCLRATGYVAYFQEFWVLRHANGRSPMLLESDAWYDSAKPHDARGELPLPSRENIVKFLEVTRDRIASANLIYS